MRQILQTVEEQVNPAHTAVLVVDMQNDFCAEGGFLHKTRRADMTGNKRIANNIMQLVRATRARGAQIAWIRAIYDHKYLPDPQVARSLSGAGEGLCMEGSWGADFYEVEPAEGEIIVNKHCYDAFTGTDLDRQLRNLGVKTLLITGVATNICVDSTLRGGFFHGYYIVVADDCVGSANQAGHDGTLTTVRQNFGAVMASSDLIELLEITGAAAAAE